MISGLGPLSRTEKLVTSGAFYKHAECLTLGTSGDAVTSFQLLYYTQMASVHEVTFQVIRSLRGGRSEIACHALRLHCALTHASCVSGLVIVSGLVNDKNLKLVTSGGGADFKI